VLAAAHIQKYVVHKCSVKWLHRAILVLVTSLCLEVSLSAADTESDFVLMTSACSMTSAKYSTVCHTAHCPVCVHSPI